MSEDKRQIRVYVSDADKADLIARRLKKTQADVIRIAFNATFADFLDKIGEQDEAMQKWLEQLEDDAGKAEVAA